jgi:NMD protein affecting ribosome stability and mRNA decay
MSIPQLQVANCPRCGRVFQKNMRNQCMDCSREIDTALNKCIDYLLRNRRASQEQVSQQTGVPFGYITTWIKEGKVLISDYPNLNYPCNCCGEPIRKHKMCLDCMVKLNREIQKMNEKTLTSASRSGGGFQIRERLGRTAK